MVFVFTRETFDIVSLQSPVTPQAIMQPTPKSMPGIRIPSSSSSPPSISQASRSSHDHQVEAGDPAP